MTEDDDIEAAVALATAETGVRGGARIRLCLAPPKHENNRRWTAEEDAYVREHHGRLSEEAIASHLGRTLSALTIHVKREMKLTAVSKSPEILTAEQVAWGLGMGCGKTVHRLMDEGLMPHRRLPMQDLNRVIDRQVLLRWMLDPAHWVYFKPERVGLMRPRGNRTLSDCYDFEFWEQARKVVLVARAAWKDEWLTPGQAARIIGINPALKAHNVNRAIHVGSLPAVRWGNWWILRSSLPASDMTINVYGKIVPKVKPKYACPRGMAKHVNPSTCMKLRFCREMTEKRTQR